MWICVCDMPVTLFSRARRVLNDKVVKVVHHHDDFFPVLFKYRAGITHHSSQSRQVKTSLHPGVATYTTTLALLVFTVAIVNHTTVGIYIPGLIIQSFQFGEAVYRGGH